MRRRTKSSKGQSVTSLNSLLIAASLLALSACAAQPEIRYVSNPVPLPPQPELPKIQAEELECIGDEIYRRLVKRELLQRHHITILENLIRTTHEQ